MNQINVHHEHFGLRGDVHLDLGRSGRSRWQSHVTQDTIALDRSLGLAKFSALTLVGGGVGLG